MLKTSSAILSVNYFTKRFDIMMAINCPWLSVYSVTSSYHQDKDKNQFEFLCHIQLGILLFPI